VLNVTELLAIVRCDIQKPLKYLVVTEQCTTRSSELLCVSMRHFKVMVLPVASPILVTYYQ